MGPLTPLGWSAWHTRFVLFTGKGGVGKTTVASSVAVALADAGRRVLLVSTDPASNIADVFGIETGLEPVPVLEVPHLDVMDLDPQAAADGYRERVIAPHRPALDAAELAALEEQLAGACTVEVAAFDAFSRLLGGPSFGERYDHIVFDTAPTGHTLRLLALPAAWSHYLTVNPEETSCLGPLAGLQGQRHVYEQAVGVLADPALTTLVLVAQPEHAALRAAARAAAELAELGLTNQRLVVNGILTEPLAGDRIAQSYARRQERALRHLPDALARLPSAGVPLVALDLVGVPALRQLARGEGTGPAEAGIADEMPVPALDDVGLLIDELASGGPGVTLVTGKGGVGKTSVAVRVARGLADHGHRVHLATTDPAGYLPVPGGADLPDSVTVSCIDPAAEAERDAARQQGAGPERLRSPCTTEVAVFRAFSRLLGLGRTQHVVIDTAPTGHTLLLLDVTGAFHRQVLHDATIPAGHITTPLMRLQDPSFTRVVLVTLAETTPVAEAAALQADLRRAGIEPVGWVLNAVLAGTGTSDPVLRARACLQVRQLERVVNLAKRVWLAPFDPDLAEERPQEMR